MKREMSSEKDEKVVRSVNWKTRWNRRVVADGTPEGEILIVWDALN